MSGSVVDTSVWIDFLAGREALQLEEALAQQSVVVPPLVVAELISGAWRSRRPAPTSRSAHSTAKGCC